MNPNVSAAAFRAEEQHMAENTGHPVMVRLNPDDTARVECWEADCDWAVDITEAT